MKEIDFSSALVETPVEDGSEEGEFEPSRIRKGRRRSSDAMGDDQSDVSSSKSLRHRTSLST